jgi:hypothetical protein
MKNLRQTSSARLGISGAAIIIYDSGGGRVVWTRARRNHLRPAVDIAVGRSEYHKSATVGVVLTG